MKRYLFVFLLGVAAGVIGLWQVEERLGADSIQETREIISEELAALDPAAIKEELMETSMVVREKAIAAGKAIKDTQITATIKAKLIKEFNLSSINISVTTAKGLVTLSGTADTHEQVGRAVKIALDTEGVSKVVSTIQVKTPEQGATNNVEQATP